MPDLWTKTGSNSSPEYHRPDGVKIRRLDTRLHCFVLVDKAGNVVTRGQRYLGCANPEKVWNAASLEQAKRGAAEVIPFLGEGK